MSAARPQLRTLIIEDSEFDALILATHLEEAGYQVRWERVETAAAMRAALEREPWDVIFSDHQMPEFSADEALAVLKTTGRDIPFIIVSGGIGEDKAVDLMKAGAHDFVFKGQLVRLLPAVEREMREARTRAAHREAQRQLQENARRLRLLWERSPDAILMMDPEGRVAFVNPAAETVFGWSASEFVRLNARQLFHHPDSEAETLPWEGLTEEEHTLMREFVGQRRDGTPLILEAGFSRVEFEGRPWVVAFVRDITERRQAEQALAERNREVATARAIQQGLYPRKTPALPGYQLAGLTIPADLTGGDYFDYLQMAGGDVGLVVGDVTGHGLGPALIMAATRAYLRIVALNHRNAGHILTRANTALADDLEGTDRFVTGVLVRLEARTGQLAYANAGHLAGCVLDAAGTLKARLDRRGPPLGLLSEAAYQEHPGPVLAPGELLVLVTDGLEEAEGPAGKPFGWEGILKALQAHRHQPAPQIAEALMETVRRFIGKRPPKTI